MIKGVHSPDGSAIFSATRITVGSLADSSVELSTSSRVGNKTNSWLGFIDSSEKDINSLPDWIEISPCYEGITWLTKGSERIRDSTAEFKVIISEGGGATLPITPPPSY